jgi:hypothetical protein
MATKTKATKRLEAQVNNDAEAAILMPYVVECEITGTSPILFHRWSCEDVEAKATAAKNSKAKKTDNIEAYLYRNDKREICIPTEYFRQSIITAAKCRQDPRSPRKSACDLFKASVLSISDLATTGCGEPDYIDKRRVCVQRAGITRLRPALDAGWKVRVLLQVQTPEYIAPSFLLDVMADAGRLVGVGDFRPTYGRFQVSNFSLLAD